MRKWLMPTIFITLLAALLAFIVTYCPNPFKKYNHSQGIAYFKQGPIKIFPYEMEAAAMPFAVKAEIKDQRIGDKAIFVYRVGEDSVEVEFKIKQTIYRYIQKLDEETSNDFFTSTVHLTGTPQPKNYHGLYYFKLLKAIGFYVLDS